MQSMRRLFVPVLVSFAAMPLTAQKTPAPAAAPPGWEAYVRAFDQYSDRDGIVGSATLVMRNGIVLEHHEHGFGDRELHQRVDTNTIFHWGSITKTLTATSVMQLRNRGRLTLDDRVTTYLPELRRIHDPFGSVDSVTIRMLLSHSAGFQAGTWPYGNGKPWEPFEPTTWEQLAAMMPYQEIAFKPGSKFSYSNPGFIYLARIVEQLTGDPWEGYVQKNIFAPLGITRSYFGGTPYYLAEHRSNNYDVIKDPAGKEVVRANGRDFDPGITIPNGGWNAPLGDIARWVSFLTNATHGDAETRRLFDAVLPHTTLEEMWKPTHPIASPGNGPQDMGMSFFLLARRTAADTVTFVGHTGSQAGFRAFFYINPHTGDAVIAAFNTSNNVRARESSSGFSALAESALTMLSQPAARP